MWLEVSGVLLSFPPWPCAAAAAARSGAADRGSSQKPGPQEVSGSHNTLCREPPCTCAESAGNLPCPAGREKRNRLVGEIEGKGWRRTKTEIKAELEDCG